MLGKGGCHRLSLLKLEPNLAGLTTSQFLWAGFDDSCLCCAGATAHR